MKTYKTDNLDLAAYLFTKGYEPQVKYKSPTLCQYSYPIEVEKQVKQFLTGNVVCNLQKFLYARYALKQLTKKLGSLVEKEKTEDYREQYKELNGTSYWFIGVSAQPHQAIFVNTKKHIERKESGNYYPSKQLAELGAKTKLAQSS